MCGWWWGGGGLSEESNQVFKMLKQIDKSVSSQSWQLTNHFLNDPVFLPSLVSANTIWVERRRFVLISNTGGRNANETVWPGLNNYKQLYYYQC